MTVMGLLDKEQIDFLYLLAFLYIQQSKFQLALYLLRILRLHTANDAKITLALIDCLYKAKRCEEASKVMQSIDVTKLNHKLLVAYYYICSKVLWDLDQKPASRAMLQKYLTKRSLL